MQVRRRSTGVCIKMRILSITAQKPHSTGSGTYLTELVRAWDRAGHVQTVVCGIYPDDEVDFPEGVSCCPVFFTDTAAESSARADALPFPIVGMSDIMPYTSTRYRDMTPEMISMFEEAFAAAVSKAVEELDPDLIICHHLFLLTSIVRKLFPGRRIYGLSHGSDLRQMINVPALRDTVASGISKLDHVLALNETQKDRIMDFFGIEDSRISIIGSGYNDSMFNSDGRGSRADIISISEGMPVPVMISYAGKMSYSKGIPEFLSAIRALDSDPSVPFFEVTLAGGCPDESLRRELDDLPSCVTWLGQVRQDHLADIFRCSDIFVLPSYYEGLPLVLIEAMASGAVPVSTDLPGVRPWIESNVPFQNVRFVPMPEMESIDTPTSAGRKEFTQNLIHTLRELITEIDSDTIDRTRPDTSGITWSGVAGRILSI